MDMSALLVDAKVGPLSNGAASVLNVRGSLGKMAEAAKDFEAVFMAQMLKPMWEGMETDPMFGGGPGEDAMRDLLVQEYGKSMAHADNFGLSQVVMEEMIRIQEKVNGQQGVGA
jgi:Rod binding domain-containing protein